MTGGAPLDAEGRTAKMQAQAVEDLAAPSECRPALGARAAERTRRLGIG